MFELVLYFVEINVQKTKTKQNNKRTKYNTSSNIEVNK
jgi:hypothetical protein